MPALPGQSAERIAAAMHKALRTLRGYSVAEGTTMAATGLRLTRVMPVDHRKKELLMNVVFKRGYVKADPAQAGVTRGIDHAGQRQLPLHGTNARIGRK